MNHGIVEVGFSQSMAFIEFETEAQCAAFCEQKTLSCGAQKWSEPFPLQQGLRAIFSVPPNGDFIRLLFPETELV